MKRIAGVLILTFLSVFFISCSDESGEVLPDLDRDLSHTPDRDVVISGSDKDGADMDSGEMDDNVSEVVPEAEDSFENEDFSYADIESDQPDEDEIPEIVYPACGSYKAAENLGTIGHVELSEISGIAASFKNEGVFWVHNDSGAGAEIFAINRSLELLGKIVLKDLVPKDWEDMALGRCSDKECIYIGDIGDNNAVRDDLSIIKFEEPDVDSGVPFGDIVIESFETISFSYPDGPRDAESLAVHPNGALYIFSKEGASSNVYKFPEFTPDAILLHIGSFETDILPIAKRDNIGLDQLGRVTAADIHRSGNQVLVRTYGHLYEWRIHEGESFDNFLETERTEIESIGTTVQGEAACFDPNSGGIIHTSEVFQGVKPPLYELKCD